MAGYDGERASPHLHALRGDLRHRRRDRRQRGHRDPRRRATIRSAAATSVPKAPRSPICTHDPDRLRRPLRRDGDALARARLGRGARPGRRRGSARSAARTAATRSRVYQGNPTAHNLGAADVRPAAAARARHAQRASRRRRSISCRTCSRRCRCSATSCCCRCPTSIARSFLLVLGANPLASNGSIMTAPDMRGRLKAIRARGGGRRRRSAPHRDRGDRRPAPLHPARARDALLLLAMLHVIFAERLAQPGRLARSSTGSTSCAARSRAFPPERAAAAHRRRRRRRSARSRASSPPRRARSSTAASACARRSSAGSRRGSSTRSTS